MEDKLNVFNKMEDDISSLIKWKMTKMEDDVNCQQNGRPPYFFYKWNTT
jgi:hypothetical protein